MLDKHHHILDLHNQPPTRIRMYTITTTTLIHSNLNKETITNRIKEDHITIIIIIINGRTKIGISRTLFWVLTNTNSNNNNNNNNNKPQQPQPNKGKVAQAKFRCEVCDKDYNNETFYQKHVQGHTNCDTQGCTFVGSKSAVLVHQLRVHNPRYSEAFKLLESPEGLSKYLEQRKKNFPTKDNVKRKDEDLQLKIERGEIVVETKRFRDQRGRFREKKVLKPNKNYNNNNNNNNNNTSNVTANATSTDSAATTEPIGNLKLNKKIKKRYNKYI